MNEEMPHDDQLRALYRKLPADEPSAQLDDAILAAARKRARETARLRVLQRVRWSVSLAAAAGLVLTLALNRLTSEPNLKRANDSAVQLTEFAQPAGAPAPEAAPEAAPAAVPAPAPAALDSLEDRDARREDAPAAAAPSEKAVSKEENGRKQEAQPLAKDVEAGRARRKADGESPVAKLKSEKPNAPEAKASAPLASARRDGGTPPAGNEGGAGELAPASPSADALSNLKSLGYMGGSDEAAAPAPPPPAGAAAKGAAETDDVVACEAAPAQPPAPMEPWPFGLEPGLAPEEACLRVREAVHRDCRFLAGFVDMPLVPAAKVDRGRLAGRSASRLTLSLRHDKLWSVVLEFTAPDGSSTQESLIAPDPVWSPTPAPVPAPMPAPGPSPAPKE